ncbi:uncharacterized protein Dwil_GK19052 [Drosophila willistoni]|uniref:RING-type domain-containing protein n=1 Tax=Drosophila willistoni TaxID=7260 RepID=B4MWC3_DROWI|nr:uncharacterized protein LOC6642001 [Drosophila willistoni]EDW75993.1 uncharacterized protein Dwil_GK19052 [Drosophila willistoni]
MFFLLVTIGSWVDLVLLQPIAFVIETILAVLHYFLWGSWLVGYCLVEGGLAVWNFIRFGAAEISRFCNDVGLITFDVFDYVYLGTTDGLLLVKTVGQGILEFICNLLIAIGSVVLWVVLLLPRAIIALADNVLDFIFNSGVEFGMKLLNNLFLLSIGLVLLLLMHTYRHYLSMFITEFVLGRLRLMMAAKMRSAYFWTDQQLAWMMQKMRDTPMDVNSLNNRPGCVICMDRNRNIVILPCRHLCLCKECSQQFEQRFEDRCPVCRNAISSFLPVYV